MLSKDGKGQLRKACFYLSQEVKGGGFISNTVMLESGNPIVRYGIAPERGMRFLVWGVHWMPGHWELLIRQQLLPGIALGISRTCPCGEVPGSGYSPVACWWGPILHAGVIQGHGSFKDLDGTL